jgi:hypothetical protein
MSSFIVGSYLYLSVNFLNCHYTEAFSSLKIQGYKNFVRLHINKSGDLELYALGVDRVTDQWVKDPQWSGKNTTPRRHAACIHSMTRCCSRGVIKTGEAGRGRGRTFFLVDG